MDVKIKTALISVSDKSGVVDFANDEKTRASLATTIVEQVK